ncbi:hypothetical protein A8B78_14715 [Jannaschia sp. EhC01]|uniref:Uncharacterized protein n=1 Tax=Gymnodinialimonas phycosphaerae TaxID=2841589 RepID=A0A975TYW7_9RHOB|nr:hypothetical protein [Gymnodinialimonas phycosphaerae]MBY4892477.1 hypothetical protein [Gymnodinialimonas phycosphaerae]OAN77108.1 hypothetical protein A8B78_14715 [Jannaschia sp. EhC01]
MDWLVIGGSAMTVAGLGLLGYCIYEAFAAKRANLEDEAMRARLQKVVAINMGALFLSVLGLMCVVLGVFLG